MTNTPVINDKHDKPISEQWLHEFCGFFWGEGCLMAHFYKNKKWGISFHVLAQIGLRQDDAEVLVHICDRLGGRIDGPDKLGHLRWRLTSANLEDCYRLVLIFNRGVLPAVKRRQVEYWARCLDIKRNRPANGYAYEDAQIDEIKFLVKTLKQLKQVNKVTD